MASAGDPKSLFVRNKCTKIKDDPKVYLPNSVETYDDGKGWIRRVEIGRKRDFQEIEKVIIIVGATGSGKTTLINAMFNHIIGVEWKDDYRMMLIEEEAAKNQAQSVTSCLTAYTIHHQPWFKTNYALTIIDTPGFGDTRGITRDEEITKQIENFFRMEAPRGIDRLDAVGFVAPSALPRLTPTQSFIFDKVLSLFGTDIADNIFMLLTFDDGSKPATLSAIQAAEIPYRKYIRFNNGILYNIDHDNMMQSMVWENGRRNFAKFFDELDAVEARSLTLTREVIEERKQLENAVQIIQANISWNARTLEELNQEQQILKDHEKDIDKNKNFTYKVYGQYAELEPLLEGHTAVNCKNCNVTCLQSTSSVWNNENLSQCWLFRASYMFPGGGGKCQRCTGKCKASEHEVNDAAFVFKSGLIEKSLDDLRQSYDQGGKMTAKEFIEVCKKKIAEVIEQTLEFVETAKNCLDRLEEIALKPNPLSVVEYIDLMIENEKDKTGEALEKRLAPLRELKEKAKIKSGLGEKVGKKVGYFERKIKGGILKMTHLVDKVKQADGTIKYKVKKLFS